MSSQSLIKLKSHVVVKNQGEGQSLVLDIHTNDIFNCNGDMAMLLTILYEDTGAKSISFELLKQKLAERSSAFRENADRDAHLQQALDFLIQLGFLEASPEEIPR